MITFIDHVEPLVRCVLEPALRTLEHEVQQGLHTHVVVVENDQLHVVRELSPSVTSQQRATAEIRVRFRLTGAGIVRFHGEALMQGLPAGFSGFEIKGKFDDKLGNFPTVESRVNHFNVWKWSNAFRVSEDGSSSLP